MSIIHYENALLLQTECCLMNSGRKLVAMKNLVNSMSVNPGIIQQNPHARYVKMTDCNWKSIV